ncbi:MAG: NAD-dependent epimerase/dehydratase family protein [Patescibacteria group bacterium]
MKIVVTGGAGFIASHIIDYLLREGHQVLSLDNFTLGTRDHFKHHLNNPNFKFIEMDVSQEERVNQAFKEFKPECVFHMAANSDIGAGSFDAKVDLKNTFGTTVAVLEAMKKNDAKQIIFPSTSAIYGQTEGAIAENSGPLMPQSNYGAAKLAAEGFIFAFAHVNNIRVWIFRFPNVCGPRGTHGVFINFLRFLKADPTQITVAQDGKQAKPYIYVLDLVDAIMLGWQKSQNQYNVFNIGNAPLVSVNEILASLLKEKGLGEIKIHYTGNPAWPGDVVTYTFDDSKIRVLGYKPKFNSKEATDKTAYELVHNPDAYIAVYRD